MDDFKTSGYNPEDEYEPIDSAPAGDTKAQPDPEPQQSAEPQITEPQNTAPQYTAPQNNAQPPYGQPVYGQAPPVLPYQQQAPYAQQYAQPQQRYDQPPQGYNQQYNYPAQQQIDPRFQPPQQPYYPPRPQQQYQQPTQQQYPPQQQYMPDRAVPTDPRLGAYVNPYGNNTQNTVPNAAPVQQKAKTPTGTKVFIIILCALLLAMILGFVAYIASNAKKNSDDFDSFDNGFSIIDGDDGSSDNNPFFNNNSSVDFKDIEDEITLKPDNGDTQKRGDENADSVGTPDEKAKDITLEALPKDKDDEKYTTQSAYDSVSPSVVTVMCYEDEISDNEKDIKAQGTGTIISTDGYIVTNAHVIENSKHYVINIVLNSGDTHQAKVIGYDTWTDLAVLKIDAKDLKAVTFGDSDLIEIGDEVIAIGSPGGVKFKNSLTKGIVSAVDRELSINRYVRYIQSDAAISPGNSGGPLCNIYGQVIGITTAKTIATNYENMSFSIPSQTVEEIVGDLMRYGYVKGRARVGFTGTEITEQEAMYYGYPRGVVVSEIDENGSLAGTNIKEGDIITEIDGETVTSFQDIYNVLANHEPGDKVTIKAQRQE